MARKHDPWDVALRADIVGTCGKCRHHCYATLTAYYNRVVTMHCHSCGAYDQFTPDDATWTSASSFVPWEGDEDDEKGKMK